MGHSLAIQRLYSPISRTEAYSCLSQGCSDADGIREGKYSAHGALATRTVLLSSFPLELVFLWLNVQATTAAFSVSFTRSRVHTGLRPWAQVVTVPSGHLYWAPSMSLSTGFHLCCKCDVRLQGLEKGI